MTTSRHRRGTTASTTAHIIQVSIDGAYRARVDAARLRAAARAALRQQGASPGDITIQVTGDEALQRLNLKFLGFDETTDVLSFPSEDINPETGRRYYGDIIISYPRARQQAGQGKHPVWAELQLLVVHGVLHLLGHDHSLSEHKQRMWAAQADVLARIKAPITGPHAG